MARSARKKVKPPRADIGGETMRPVTTQTRLDRLQGLSRRRRSIARGLSRRFSWILWRHPVVPAVLLILMAVLMYFLIARYPSVMPWSSFLPLVVLAGLFLPPRWLALVLLVIAGLMAYDGTVLAGNKTRFVSPVIR